MDQWSADSWRTKPAAQVPLVYCAQRFATPHVVGGKAGSEAEKFCSPRTQGRDPRERAGDLEASVSTLDTTPRDVVSPRQADEMEAKIAQTLGNIASEKQGLVPVAEIEALNDALVDAGRGKKFMLHMGDCAEKFADCTQAVVEAKAAFQRELGSMIEHGFAEQGRAIEVVNIGRIAGQFSKPRSKEQEMVDGVLLNSYRGEAMNGFDPSDRSFDPERLDRAHSCAATALRHMNRRAVDGPSPLKKLKKQHSSSSAATVATASLDTSSGSTSSGNEEMSTSDCSTPSAADSDFLFASHEGLLLPLEEAFLRTHEESGNTYCTSAHMLWIGERTRQLDGAHCEFFRGIANPIGVKVGPAAAKDPESLIATIRLLNPDNAPARITLITRFGCKNVDSLLAPLVKAVATAGVSVLWEVDPMHGNTVDAVAECGRKFKTRHFADICAEVRATLAVLKAQGLSLNGLHLEATFDADVTECLGPAAQSASDMSPRPPTEAEDLKKCYTSFCDPRLNREQTKGVVRALLGCYTA